MNPTFNGPQNVPQNVSQNLTERQKQIIDNLKKNPKMTRSALASILGVTVKTIQRELSDISNIVRFEGLSKGGQWEFINNQI